MSNEPFPIVPGPQEVAYRKVRDAGEMAAVAGSREAFVEWLRLSSSPSADTESRRDRLFRDVLLYAATPVGRGEVQQMLDTVGIPSPLRRDLEVLQVSVEKIDTNVTLNRVYQQHVDAAEATSEVRIAPTVRVSGGTRVTGMSTILDEVSCEGTVECEDSTLAGGGVFSGSPQAPTRITRSTVHTSVGSLVASSLLEGCRVTLEEDASVRNSTLMRVEGDAGPTLLDAFLSDVTWEGSPTVNGIVVANSHLGGTVSIGRVFAGQDYGARLDRVNAVGQCLLNVAPDTVLRDCRFTGAATVNLQMGVVENVEMSEGFITIIADVHAPEDVEVIRHGGATYTRWRIPATVLGQPGGWGQRFRRFRWKRGWAYSKMVLDPLAGVWDASWLGMLIDHSLFHSSPGDRYEYKLEPEENAFLSSLPWPTAH